MCKDSCKGLYFRYSASEFVSKRGSLEKRESYRLLKRMSCNGDCSADGKRCIVEFFYDDLDMVGLSDAQVKYPEDPKDGDVYYVRPVMGSPDWETGYIEEWTWVFRKVNHE